jgi:hypothetical protein
MVRLLLLLLPHLPSAIIATPGGLMFTGSGKSIPLPPHPFAWERGHGFSELSASIDGDAVTMHWRLDRRGPSYLHFLIEQRPGAINLQAYVQYPQSFGEYVIDCESYRSWDDLMRHRHTMRLASDLFAVLRRSGIELNG